MPKPPSDAPEWNETKLGAKLSQIRKTTRLSFHSEPRITAAGEVTFDQVQNEWAIVYALFVGSPELGNLACDDVAGCDGFDGMPLVLIAEPKNVHAINEDGTFKPDLERWQLPQHL